MQSKTETVHLLFEVKILNGFKEVDLQLGLDFRKVWKRKQCPKNISKSQQILFLKKGLVRGKG